jgi:hypothetical protein
MFSGNRAGHNAKILTGVAVPDAAGVGVWDETLMLIAAAAKMLAAGSA